MQGQWTGPYTSNENGSILLDIDDMGTHYAGYAILRPSNPLMPVAFVSFFTPDKSSMASLEAVPLAFNPQTYEPVPWDIVKSHYEGVLFPQRVTATLSMIESNLHVEWRTNLPTTGIARLTPSEVEKPSTYEPIAEVSDWDGFVQHVRRLPHYEFIYRGQSSNAWRLRTTFHRTGRWNMARYHAVDMQAVQKTLSARSSLKLHDPLDYGAFVSLIQHHGYPTPLLDWTHSPFVAAYFAFSTITNKTARAATENDKVRIFKFAKSQWLRDNFQVLKLAPMYAHFSILDALASENPRMIPQQGISSITNVEDVEQYIQHMEAINNKTYLEVFDLPVVERPRVMRELAIMGVTAGSLFPGLDGACAELRERFFDI